MFPNRVPIESDAPSPEPMVYSLIYIRQDSSVKGSSHENGENIRSPSTEPHADGRPTYNAMVAQENRLRHCHYYPSAMYPSAQYLPPWLGYTRAPLATVRLSNPNQGIPSTPVTASHVTQGKVDYEFA
jgi:hypothetical protein